MLEKWQASFDQHTRNVEKTKSTLMFIHEEIGEQLSRLGFGLNPSPSWWSVDIEKGSDLTVRLHEFEEAVELINSLLKRRGHVITYDCDAQVYKLECNWYSGEKYSYIELADKSTATKSCPVEIIREVKEVLTTKVNCPSIEALNKKE